MILGTDELRGGWGVASTKSIYTVLKLESDSSTMALLYACRARGVCRAARAREEARKSPSRRRVHGTPTAFNPEFVLSEIIGRQVTNVNLLR
jgi:hypothetical protein